MASLVDLFLASLLQSLFIDCQSLFMTHKMSDYHKDSKQASNVMCVSECGMIHADLCFLPFDLVHGFVVYIESIYPTSEIVLSLMSMIQMICLHSICYSHNLS